MINRILGVIASVTLVTLFSGCSHAPLSKSFNEANANNIAVQTINPNAGKQEAAEGTLDGQKSENILQRYRTDTGKAPKDVLINVGQ